MRGLSQLASMITGGAHEHRPTGEDRMGSVYGYHGAHSSICHFGFSAVKLTLEFELQEMQDSHSQEDDGAVNSSKSASLRFGIQALEYNLGRKGGKWIYGTQERPKGRMEPTGKVKTGLNVENGGAS